MKYYYFYNTKPKRILSYNIISFGISTLHMHLLKSCFVKKLNEMKGLNFEEFTRVYKNIVLGISSMIQIFLKVFGFSTVLRFKVS